MNTTLAVETIMDGVQEYVEEHDVVLCQTEGMSNMPFSEEERKGYGRWVVKGVNEGGFNSTEIDLLQLIAWLRKNRPEFL